MLVKIELDDFKYEDFSAKVLGSEPAKTAFVTKAILTTLLKTVLANQRLVSHNMQAAEQNIKKVGKAVGKHIKHAAKDVHQSVKEATKDVRHGVRDAMHSLNSRLQGHDGADGGEAAGTSSTAT